MSVPADPLLIFDLGNVILRHDNALLMRRLAAKSRLPEKAVPDLIGCFDHGMDVGDETLREAFEREYATIGFKAGYEAFADIWCSHFSHDLGMEDLVERLSQRYRLVILSNTNAAHWEYLMGTYPILQTPHARYTSFELRLRKPNAAIYRHVLEREGRSPDSAVFIDDKLENVEAARALGIHGIHFTGRDALVAELAALNVSANA